MRPSSALPDPQVALFLGERGGGRADVVAQHATLGLGKTAAWFAAMYQRARELQADYLVQNNVDLGEDLLHKQETVSMAAVQAHRVVMDDRRWYAARMFRKQYGDDPAVAIQQDLRVQVPPEQLEDIRARLERVRAQAPPPKTLPEEGR
jgi:terminase small subunit-like protein